jgi:hypothetical protein
MQEESMEQVQEVDGCAGAEGRLLLAAAFETAPLGDGLAGSGPVGAELLRQVRRRTAARRRTRARVLVPAGAVASLALAGAVAAVTLTATVAVAPSAVAAVTAAAAKTSAQTFKVTMDIATNPPPVPGSGRAQAARVTGAFDQSRGVGQETVSGAWKFQVRYVGHNTYLHTYPGSKQVIFSADQRSKPWAEFPPEPALTGNALDVAGNSPDGTPADPITLLRLLKSAGKVTDEGPASGSGWTGTRYGFTVTVNEQTTVGYLDVDGQGRVRRLVADLTAGVGKKKWVMSTEDVTFGDFGAPVSVTTPPASQVYLLKGPVAMIALGW